MAQVEYFDLPNIPSAYLSHYAEGNTWGVICNGIPVAQGSHMECLAAAKRLKVELPNYHWVGSVGKWAWSIFNN